MTQNDPKVLEVAYSAVKMQRMNADIKNLWGKNPEIRENYVHIEAILRDALIEAKKLREERLRGGSKPQR